MYGETFSPQNLPEAPWVDDVQQSVSVNQKLNQKNVLPRYCTGSTIDTCKKMFVHQAGAYQKDAAIVVSRDVTWCHQKLGMKAHSPARTWLGLGLGFGVRVRS